MFPSSCAAIEAIGRFAKSRPESPALIDPDGAILDYEELWGADSGCWEQVAGSRRWPARDGRDSASPGQASSPRSCGCLHHGTCAPLQPRTTVDDVSVLLEKLGATALIVSLEFESETQAAIEMEELYLSLTVLNLQENGKFALASPSPGRTAVADAVLLLITSATTDSLENRSFDVGESRCPD